MTQDMAEGLAGRLRGRVVQATDADYDQVRAVWNGMIDRRPAALVRCAGTSDVIEAVRYARARGLMVAVRGGGHNVSGTAVCDDGLVVDLTPMRGVRVDPAAGTVRAAGGVTIGDLDSETQAFGLAVPMGVVTETGIAGLTLGGGLGWLRRKYGLSCDNLISADVVTADGRVVVAESDPDLLWALKGGGGNFGVVTSFEFRAYPVGPDVFFAQVIHAGTDARSVLRAYREWAAAAPDEISSFAILWHAPEDESIPAEHHGTPIVVFAAMHSGTPEEGEAALQPLRDIGTPIADLSAATSYLEAQRFFDEDYPAHVMRYYWKSRYLTGLPDDLIDVLVELNEGSPSPHSTLDVWQLGGAFARPGTRDTAFGDRSAPFMLGIESNWENPADDEACIAWARRVHTTLGPFSTGAEYLNFPGLYEDSDRTVRDTFGPNLDRLAVVKRRYDPDNVFRLTHNIRPS
ncbi:FAD-binding oxidoreductase [Thermomonospora cellulosilytica]|uniref:FAD/FMN-containing dehydrogenase n=1 Tax=Thermomonospora cellulosilytica TaxID=1411118 RepID=A0A7W3MW42_9ACTN|nr:FAD-binding oxidoreductase [Thermomonospora cellulosilytica]MBA9002973.1 FAD/FMN-containing dehydrogenase [Thermomonospora cellulosilytica]